LLVVAPVVILVIQPCFLPGEARAQAAAKTPAQAPPDVRAKATALLREGARMMDEGRYSKALDSFQEAYRLVPSPKVLFNLGVAYTSLSRHAEAVDAFEGFLRQAPDAPPSSRDAARRHVAELRSKVATLALVSDRASGRISVDGRDLGTVPFNRELTVDPGQHQVRATAGDKSVESRVDVAAGSRTALTLTFDEPMAAPVAVPPPPAAGQATAPPGLAVVAPPPAAALVVTAPAQMTVTESPGISATSRPLYRRPWVWIAGGGVIAVAAVVLAVSLSGTEYPTADRTIGGP
jgi:hypothetical protein